MKKVILLALIIYSIPSFSQEQEEQSPKPSFTDKIFIGGSFGLAFGDNTYVDLSPVIGYKLTPRFNVALGPIYQYWNYKPWNISYSNYGGRVMGIAKIYGPVFAQVEYEYLNWEYFYSPNESERLNNSAFLVGAGVSQPVGRNIFFNATALYNVTYSNNPRDQFLYPDPWVFRVGVTAGF